MAHCEAPKVMKPNRKKLSKPVFPQGFPRFWRLPRRLANGFPIELFEKKMVSPDVFLFKKMVG